MIGIFELVESFKASWHYEKRFKEVQERALLKPDNLFIQVRLADLLAKLRKKKDAVGVYERVAQQFIQKNLFAHAIALKKIIFRLEPPKDAEEAMIVLQRLHEQKLTFRETTSIAEEQATYQTTPSSSPSSETTQGGLKLEPKVMCSSAS